VTMNIRPQNSAGLQGYSPYRDIAYLFPALVAEVFSKLDECNWGDATKQACHTHQISEQEIAEACGKLGAALAMYIREPTISSPFDALQRSGFLESRLVVQDLVFARFGESIAAGWFVAVRDVTLQGEASDAAPDMARMLAAARSLADRRSPRGGDGDQTPVDAIALLRVEVSETRRALEQARRLRQELVDSVAEQVTKNRGLQEQLQELQIANERLQGAAKIANLKIDAVREVLKNSRVLRLFRKLVSATR